MAPVRHQSSITSLSWIPGGQRTSTLVAVTTPCRVAVVEAAELDRRALHELSKDHRRTSPDRS